MYDNQKARIEALEREVQVLRTQLGAIGEMMETLAIQNANLALSLSRKSTDDAEDSLTKLIETINKSSSIRSTWEAGN
ncbi:hypothetical protein PXK58_09000 [Phaeobacter gallaeciensis]|uniref:hypothetical protein n=1 Tax=Phaeobacter gallaeciensis TaxID=60890 RepID=UPI002380A8CB|nr:hypothetical protein [Phaeobacter gallaeciensis]MDE4274737.1 hypothetical protein [Phaeobacter gallaeciensis]MDE4299689.1 hypothetical protein [Phaeobacter gallaeciensis]MDE5184854.1 hypothetical protein [Phaeobacter gallaeciensis]